MTSPQLLTAWAGHWTSAGTGVTVILPPPGTVGSGEVRGGAPATREFALLDPVRLVDRVDAVVLSGGSALGLAAGDGVAGLLRERGEGFPTPYGPVPIVVGMSLFDASVGGTPPGAAAGRSAALAALSGAPFGAGPVGAGAGASTGKWRGRADPGGIGVARGQAGAASLVAVVAVNAWGDVISGSGVPLFEPSAVGPSPAAPFNTTLGVLITDAALTKSDCFLLAQSGHTGFARALHPSHSRYDGDAVVALATGSALALPAAPAAPLAPASFPVAAPSPPAASPAAGSPAAASPSSAPPSAASPSSAPPSAASPRAASPPSAASLPAASPPAVDLDQLRAVAASVMAEAIRSAVTYISSV